MSDENPVAQGTEAAPIAEGNQGTSPGVQARIDELVAKNHERDRQIAEQQATIASMMATFAQQSAAQSRVAPQEQPPPFEIDPEEQRKLDYFMSQKIKPMEAYIQRLEQSQVQSQFQQYQSQVPPEVLGRAQELKLAWVRSGKQGWVDQDALTYAYGEYNLKQAQQGHQRQYNQAASNVSMQGAPPPPAPQATNFGLPKDIDSRPLHERIALRERALQDVPWDE